MAANWLKSLFPRLTSRRMEKASGVKPNLVQLEDRATPANFQLVLTTTPNVTEGAPPGTATVTVTLDTDAPLAGNVTFQLLDTLNTEGATATSGSDYGAFTNEVLTFAAGSVDDAKFVRTVTINNDVRVEAATETIIFKYDITNVVGDTLIGPDNDTQTTIITDNDTATVTLGGGPVTVTEGQPGVAGLGGVTAKLTLTANGSPIAGILDTDLTVTLATADDFTSNSITFAKSAVVIPLLGATQTFTVAAKNDRIVEADEDNLMATLAAVPPTGTNPFVTTAGMATVNVRDDDSVRVFTGVGAPTLTEGGMTTFGVGLEFGGSGTGTPELGVPITVDLNGGPNADYTTTPAVIPSGSTAAGGPYLITVNGTEDVLVEGKEVFAGQVVTVTNKNGADADVRSTNAGSNDITINDNDSVRVFTTDFNLALTESAAAPVGTVGLDLAFTVVGAGTPTLAVPIQVNLSPGPGADADYTVPTLTIPAGALAGQPRSLMVNVENDARVELVTETFNGRKITVTDKGPASLMLDADAKADTGTVNISITDNDSVLVFTGKGTPTVAEGASTVIGVGLEFTVDASGTQVPELGVPITVDLNGGPNADYTTTATVIPIGATAAGGPYLITVNGTDDLLVEAQSETFSDRVVTVTNDGGANVGVRMTGDGPGDNDIVITDNDFAHVFTGSATLPAVAEGATQVYTVIGLTITANGMTNMGTLDVPITVNLTPGPGAGNDYSVTPTVIPIGAASGVYNLTINGLDDLLVEASTESVDRQVIVTDDGDADVAVGVTGTLTLQITDVDAATVSIAAGANTTTVGEGATANVPVTLAFAAGANQLAIPVSVNLTADPNTPADFTAAAVTIPANSTAGTFNVVVTGVDDRRVEGTESVAGRTLVFTSTPAGNVTVSAGSGTSTIQVTDNDTAVLRFASATSQQDEASPPPTNAKVVPVELFLTTPGTGTVGIDKQIKGTVTDVTPVGQPVPGTDYTFTTTDVTFVAGANATGQIISSSAVVVTVIDDASVEASEFVNLSLALTQDDTVTQASLGANAHALEIISLDAATISVTDAATDPALREAGVLTFTVSLSNPVDQAVTVTFTTTGNSATSGVDFTPVTTTVTFPANDNTPITVQVMTVDDRRLEGTETFTVTLSDIVVAQPRNVTFADATGVGTILDNETATLTFDAASSGTTEDNTGPITVGVTLTIVPIGTGLVGIDRDVEAGVVITGSATQGAGPLADYKYTALPTPTFATGANADANNKLQDVIQLEVFEDLSDEPAETVVATINLANNLSGQVSVGTAQHTFTIANDDSPVRTYDATVTGNYRLVRLGNDVQLYRDGVLVAQDPLGTTQILLNGTGGNDTFTIDFSGGNPIPQSPTNDPAFRGVRFDGKGGADTLFVSGGAFANIADNFTDAVNGSLVTDLGNVQYTDTDAVRLEVASVASLTFSLPAGSHTLSDNSLNTAQGKLVVGTPAASDTTFTKPTGSLGVNRGAATDLTVGALALSAALNVGASGAGFNAITQTGPVTVGNNLAYFANTIAVNGTLNAANATLVAGTSTTQTAAITTGLLTLGEAGNLGDYALTNAANNAATLVVPQAKNVNVADADNLTLGAITTTQALGVTLPGIITVAGGVVVQSQTGPVNLAANTAISAAANATVRALGGSVALTTGSLTLAAGAATTATGGGLTATVGGGIDVGGGATVQGDGLAVSAGGAVTVGANGTVLATVGDIVLTAGAGLSVAAAGTVQATVGNLTTNVTGNLTATGANLKAGNGLSAAASGAVDLGANTTVQAAGISLSANGSLSAGAATLVNATGGDLVVTAGGLTVTGSSFQVTPGNFTANVTGNLTASGATLKAGNGLSATVTGAIDLGANTTLQAAGVGLSAGGAVTVGASTVTATTANLTVTAGNGATVTGSTLQATAGTFIATVTGNLTASGATLKAGNGLTATATGATDLGANTTLQAAGLALNANGAFTAGASTSVTATGGDIVLTSGGSISLAGGGTPTTLQSNIGTVTVAAADNLIAPGAALRAGGTISIAIDAGNADPGVGATVNLNGATIAAAFTTIDGNTDNDTFLVTGYTTPVRIDGKAPTGTPTGDTLVFDAENKGVASGPNSFDTAGAPVSYFDIESVTVVNVGVLTGFTVNGTDGDDYLTVTRTPAGPLQYQFGNGVPVVIAPITKFTFNGLKGRDTLVADFSQGTPIPTGGIAFDGGEDADFGLLILGAAGKATTATVTPGTGSGRTGTVDVDGLAISYTNLEPNSQVDITNLPTVNLNLATADPAITVNTGLDNTTKTRDTQALVVSGNSIPQIGLFNNTTVNLNTAANGGADAVTVLRGDNNHKNVNLNVNAADDQVSINGSLAVTGDLRITAATTGVTNADVTAGGGLELNNSAALNLAGTANLAGRTVAQTGGGAVNLATDALAKVSAPETILFSGTVDGKGSLTLVNAGTTTFSKAVGGTTAVGNLTTDAGGRTQINGGLVKTSVSQTYNDAVNFSTGTKFEGHAGTLTFRDALEPDADNLDLTIGGPNVDVQVDRAIGASRNVRTLTIFNAKNATFNGPTVTTNAVVQTTGTGTTTFKGEVRTPSVVIANANNVTFGGPVNTPSLVQNQGGGTTTFNGGVNVANGAAGTFNVTNNSVVFNSPVSFPDGRLILGLNGGSATQGGNGPLTAAKIDLRGTGTFNLNNPANELTAGRTAEGEVFATLQAGSSFVVRDKSDLVVAFEDPSRPAITMAGGKATLSTAANFRAVDPTNDVNAPIDANGLVKLIDVGAEGTVQVNFGQTADSNASFSVTFLAEARAKLITFGQPTEANGKQPDTANRGKDTFTVRPTLDAAIFVYGNLPTAADSSLRPFDTLAPQLTGITIDNLTTTGDGGTYTFSGGFEPLMFAEIETLNGFTLEAFAVQTLPSVGTQNPNSYAVRGLFTQLNNSFKGSITGSGVVTNPFVVTPSLGSSASGFRAPSIAAGFVNDDLIPDLIIGSGAGETPLVTIVDGNAFLNSAIDLSSLRPEQIIDQFFAYEPTFRGGVNVTAADFDKDGRAEIVVGSGVGGGPRVTIFKLDLTQPKSAPNRRATIFDGFVYEESFRGGVNVAVGDVNNDKTPDLIAGSGVGGGPRVRVFSGFDTNTVLADFFAYESTARGGVLVASGQYNGDEADDILTAPAFVGGPRLRVYLGGAMDGPNRAGLFTPDPTDATGTGRVSLVNMMAFDTTSAATTNSLISSNNTVSQGTGGIAFGASQDGSGRNRTILVSRPVGARFDVLNFTHDAESGQLTLDESEQAFSMFVNSAEGDFRAAQMPFDKLQGGGTVTGTSRRGTNS